MSKFKFLTKNRQSARNCTANCEKWWPNANRQSARTTNFESASCENLLYYVLWFLSQCNCKGRTELRILSETKIFKQTEHFLIYHLCWVDLLMLILNGCFNFYSLYERYVKYDRQILEMTLLLFFFSVIGHLVNITAKSVISFHCQQFQQVR